MPQPDPQILPVDPASPDAEAVRAAVQALQRGQLVVLPTETVYGLAADSQYPDAELNVYRAKGRPENKPLPLLAADAAQAEAFGAAFTEGARRLASRFWPGPLTMVLEARGTWEGFRVPDHAVALAVLRAIGRCLRVTSANRSGEPPACSAAEARVALGAHVVLILDAGPCRIGTPSTVVQFRGEELVVLREGAIPPDQLRACLA